MLFSERHIHICIRCTFIHLFVCLKKEKNPHSSFFHGGFFFTKAVTVLVTFIRKNLLSRKLAEFGGGVSCFVPPARVKQGLVCCA